MHVIIRYEGKSSKIHNPNARNLKNVILVEMFIKKKKFNYRISLFSDACFNTMNRIFGAWSNIDLTIPMDATSKNNCYPFEFTKSCEFAKQQIIRMNSNLKLQIKN
ncbi:hypothetical protein BpHYR1_017223 [Brachionus plicatilis]|uniref:Uncharacterized protein n=1 Tax=Brachionus plicatilis TaxID=10195 RepID=A0A3M7QR74_BRAPC|nr:hypothetical protein BpHYR1_017223 [Brachionus plicatilis]